MKKICCCLKGKYIMFEVNWFEYIILKNIFKKKRYQITTSHKFRGQRINTIIYDEVCEFKK